MNKETYINEVNSIKEVISNMPQTTKKNKQKYLVYIKEKLDIYTSKKDNTIKEITSRYNNIIKKIPKNNIDYEQLTKEKDEVFYKLMILNKNNSPYEKIGLDKYIFNINHYYEENLDFLNNEIKNAIECFEKVNINLSSDDFWYSTYVNEYMNAFLLKSDNLKNTLDKIYWKSPNLINQIAMNINDLYYKYEKNFINYFNKEKEKILTNNSYQELLNKYNELKEQISEKDFNISIIVNKIIEEKENINDLSEEKYESYLKLFSDTPIDNSNLIKLNNTLYEYKIYKEYKFIIDKFIEIYKEKDKYKNSYKTLKKEIDKQEKNIIKINKKINFQQKWIKKQDKIEILELSLNNEINTLKDKYKNLEIEKINELISTLNNNTSYYDILSIIASNYSYLRKILTENNEEITDDEINKIELFLLEFISSNKLNILDNIRILDENSITNIISSRYRLLNIKIEPDEIDNNLENIIDIIRKIKIIDIIKNSNVSYKELVFLVNTKNIVIN